MNDVKVDARQAENRPKLYIQLRDMEAVLIWGFKIPNASKISHSVPLMLTCLLMISEHHTCGIIAGGE